MLEKLVVPFNVHLIGAPAKNKVQVLGSEPAQLSGQGILNCKRGAHSPQPPGHVLSKGSGCWDEGDACTKEQVQPLTSWFRGLRGEAGRAHRSR